MEIKDFFTASNNQTLNISICLHGLIISNYFISLIIINYIIIFFLDYPYTPRYLLIF